MTAALRIDARRPRWKPLPQPHALERAYYARLMAVVNRTFGLLRKKLATHLPADARRQDAAEDEPPDNFKAVTFTIEEVEFELAESFPATSIRKAAESTASEIDNAHLRATRRQFAEATGINILKEAPKLRPTVEEFTKENVALIKSIPKEAMEGLRHALVTAGLEKGVRPERLAKMLEERYGIAQRRAQLIATDQVGKLMSTLTEERHRELGVTKYRWRTSRDNRVRRLHVKREGKVYSYDDPPHEVPGDGHPGIAVRCRCWSEPLLDEVLSVKEAVEVEKKTADPAPSNAKPESRAPVESIAVAERRAERAAKQQAEAVLEEGVDPVAVAKAIAKSKASVPSPLTAKVKPPAKVRVPKTASPNGSASTAQAVQPVPVDRSKGWKPERVYLVPIEELADVPALAWNGRDKSIRKAYEAGEWEKLPPIMVVTENKATGARELEDGNHRLAVARELGAKFVKVRFGDKDAAGLRARPPNPGLPWFVREDPERFGYRIPKPVGLPAPRVKSPPASAKGGKTGAASTTAAKTTKAGSGTRSATSRKAPEKKTPPKTSRSAPSTGPSTGGSARPAKAVSDLPRGPIRGADAAEVMRIFPEVKALGDVLRVDDFQNDGVRSEVADIANLPPSLLAIVHKYVSDIHIAPKPVSELGRSGYMRQFKNERPRGFEEGKTMDHAAGLFVMHNREVLVAAHNRVGSSQGIALHEIGHALDAAHFRKPTSITDAFVDAWEEFKSGGFTHSKNPYFTQPYPAGPEETFAEAFSVYFSLGPDAVARRFGPKVVEVLNAKYGPENFPPSQQP